MKHPLVALALVLGQASVFGLSPAPSSIAWACVDFVPGTARLEANAAASLDRFSSEVLGSYLDPRKRLVALDGSINSEENIEGERLYLLQLKRQIVATKGLYKRTPQPAAISFPGCRLDVGRYTAQCQVIVVSDIDPERVAKCKDAPRPCKIIVRPEGLDLYP